MELKKHHRDFEALHFVSRAISTTLERANLQQLHVERSGDDAGTSTVVATDGSRMHIARGLEIEPGEYRVLSRTLSKLIIEPIADFIDFPDWKRVSTRVNCDVLLDEVHVLRNEPARVSRILADIAVSDYAAQRESPQVRRLDYRYIADLWTDNKWRVRASRTELGPVFFDTYKASAGGPGRALPAGLSAVIMPLSV